MSRVTLARVDQKLDDLILVVNEVNSRVKDTNGKVAEAHIELATMKSNYDNCDARQDKERGTTKGWVQWVIPLGVSFGFNVISLAIVIYKLGG